MIKKAFLNILLITTTLSLGAKTSVWKIDSDSTTLYIGGTFHLLRSADFPLPPEFGIAYDDSDTLVFETDVGKMEDSGVQQLMLSEAMLKEKTLDEVLSPKAYETLSEYFSETGMPMDPFNRFKPAMVVLTITMLEFQKLGFTTEGVDVFFYNKGMQERKAIDKLETIEEQIDFIMSMGEGSEDDFVFHSMRDLTEMKNAVPKMLRDWRNGDRLELKKNFIDPLSDDYPKLYKTLIVDRNENWLPKIESYFETKEKEFILVGVAHLVGEEGILSKLEELGYTVEALVVK